MKKLLVLSLIFLSIAGFCARPDYLVTNYKNHYSFFLNFSSYQPDEIKSTFGESIDGVLTHGGFGFFNTKDSMISLNYGYFDESKNNQTAKITPVLLEVTFFNNLKNNWKFFFGAGFGTLKLDWQPLASGASYTETDWGYSAKLGFMYFTSEQFAISLEAKYLGGTIDDALPASFTDRDMDVSDWTVGIGLNFFWE